MQKEHAQCKRFGVGSDSCTHFFIKTAAQSYILTQGSALLNSLISVLKLSKKQETKICGRHRKCLCTIQFVHHRLCFDLLSRHCGFADFQAAGVKQTCLYVFLFI